MGSSGVQNYGIHLDWYLDQGVTENAAIYQRTRRPSRTLRPTERLMLAVLEQALADAGSGDPYLRADAEVYFRDHGPYVLGLEVISDQLGLSASRIREAARQRANGGAR